MSVVKNLINKFSGQSNTEDSSTNENEQSSNGDNTAKVAGDPQAPVTDEPTSHAASNTGSKAAEHRDPISADSAPKESTTSAGDETAKEDTNDEARNEEATKDGAPAHLIPNSEHYHASSNVQHILDDAEKAEEAHHSEEAPAEAASEAKNQEAAPEKPDKAKGETEEDKRAVPATSNSDEPLETTAESGYKPSENVEHIIDDAAKAEEEHKSDDHATDQDEEAKKMDNPTAGATNASHPQSGEPAAGKADKLNTEERHDDEPAQTTTKSGYTPSDNVKQILADAEKADEAKQTDDHAVDTSHHKKLDEPTANMSVHEKSRHDD